MENKIEFVGAVTGDESALSEAVLRLLSTRQISLSYQYLRQSAWVIFEFGARKDGLKR